DAAEGGGGSSSRRDGDGDDGDVGNRTGPGRENKSREGKKARQGQNKNRRFGKVRDELDICFKIAAGTICEFGAERKYNHNVSTYLAEKPPDLRVPSIGELVDGEADSTPLRCPVFDEFRECKYGLSDGISPPTFGKLLRKTEAKLCHLLSTKELNYISAETQKLLRTKRYPFLVTGSYIRELQETDKREQEKELERKRLKEEKEKELLEGPDNVVVMQGPDQNVNEEDSSHRELQ
ncbi:hypothetical protein BDP27DRAFT_1212883, partial [Rhodocollybia butyracea]